MLTILHQFISKENSKVTFEAKVSASPGHNVLLFLMGEQELWRTSRTAGFEIFQFQLPPGYHVLKVISTFVGFKTNRLN